MSDDVLEREADRAQRKARQHQLELDRIQSLADEMAVALRHAEAVLDETEEALEAEALSAADGERNPSFEQMRKNAASRVRAALAKYDEAKS